MTIKLNKEEQELIIAALESASIGFSQSLVQQKKDEDKKKVRELLKRSIDLQERLIKND